MGNCFNTEEKKETNEIILNEITQEKQNELSNRANILEQQLLNKFVYPLDNKSLYYENIPISFQGDNTYLHTLVYSLNELKNNPNTNKKILIMIHGYQGNSLTFYKIIPYLSQKYICICPDIIGMGLSSRLKIEFKSSEQCIDFFVESIESFRISLEKNFNLKQKFILCGHSLGGYFSVSYALKYPQYIESLLLLSPTGITDVEKYGGSILENMNMALSFGMRAASPLWNYKTTIQDYSQTFLIKSVINYTLRKRFDVCQEENDILGEITEIALQYPKDLDEAIYFIFKHPFPTAVVPLEDLIKEKIPQINIIFCHGETDWMDDSGPKRLNNFDGNKYKYFTIYNAGQTFPIDNPGEVAKIILHEL